MVTTRIKASDRTKACQQVTNLLKKHYGGRLPHYDHDVLDTLLFAICLENASFQEAEQALSRLKSDYYDYNEARVSSITELRHSLQTIFVDQNRSEWKAYRIRESLQVVFEGRYSYDLEDFKKKNLETAEKFLSKISNLTPFVVSHTLHMTFGAHLVPVDQQMLDASLWLGLLEDETDLTHAADAYKSAIRKADVPLFFHYIKQLVNDPDLQPLLKQANPAKTDNPLDNLQATPDYLKHLLAGQLPPSAKPAKTKTPAASKASSSDKPADTKKKPAAGKAAPAKSKAKAKAKPKSTAKASAKKTSPPAKKATKQSAKKSTKRSPAKSSSKSAPAKSSKKAKAAKK